MALAGTWSETEPSSTVPVAPAWLGGGYGIAGNPPSRPMAAARPASWPGGQAEDQNIEQEEDSRGDDPRHRASVGGSYDRLSDAGAQAPNWSNSNPAPEVRVLPPPAPRDAQPRQPQFQLPPAEPWAPDRYGPSGGAEPWPPRNDRPASAYEQGPAYQPSAPGEPSERVARIPDRDGLPETAGTVPEQPVPGGAVPEDAVLCEGAQTVGQVGPHSILASDVWVAADAMLVRVKDKIPPDEVEANREALIKHSFRQLLKQRVEMKLIYYDAMEALPKEAVENVEDQLGRMFDKTELPKLMELWHAKSQRELDQKLMSMGTSVQRYKKAFMETTMAQQWLRQKIKIDEDVNHEQMLKYYDEHLSEFERPSQARWEQLTVRISRFPSEDAARAALAQMGNEVLDGRPFADVARQASDGPTAAQGGERKWTTKGSLVSEALDRAIFGLPVGQLSPVLQENRWLHIVRVVERQDAHRVPFVDAQVEIREKIRQQRNAVQQQAYLDDLRRRVPVWTLYGDKPESSPMAEQGG